MTKIKTNRKDVGRKTLKNLQNLITTGSLMSNVFYNLAQKVEGSISPDSLAVMKGLYTKWDEQKRELPKWIFKK